MTLPRTITRTLTIALTQTLTLTLTLTLALALNPNPHQAMTRVSWGTMEEMGDDTSAYMSEIVGKLRSP